MSYDVISPDCTWGRFLKNFRRVSGFRVLAPSPEPEAHDKLLDNSPDRIEILECWFLRRGENQSTRRKILGARTRTNNKLNPHMTTSPGIEPGHIGGRRVLSPLRHPGSVLLETSPK